MMNKFVYLLLFIFTSFYTSVSFSYHKCDKKNDIHCTYFIGDKSKKNGKYIKSTLISNNSISHVNCMSGGLSNVIPNAFGNNWKGKRTFSYEQCFDAECKQSKHLITETFIVTKKGKGFTSNPHSFNVHMRNDYGKSCDASILT